MLSAVSLASKYHKLKEMTRNGILPVEQPLIQQTDAATSKNFDDRDNYDFRSISSSVQQLIAQN